jgi:hypothetical protein
MQAFCCGSDAAIMESFVGEARLLMLADFLRRL